MTEIYNMSATDIAKQIKQRKISCEEVMRAHLERIEKINPLMNALVQIVGSQEAIDHARQADKKLSQGIPLGLFHGVPISVKDFYHVKGLTSSCGCPGLYHQPAEKDATIVSRLKEQGAIVLGLTNVPELLVCVETDNQMYGQTKNPYNLLHTSGGSSGGEAALIASGGSAFGVGSDAGGSVRIPAHCCGITALKPTQGRIPCTGNVFGNANGVFSFIATAGPLARTVDDLITGFSIMAGPDGIDPHIPPVPLFDPHHVAIKDLKIAFYTDDGYATPTPETQKCIKYAAQALKDFVKEVDENRPSGLSKTFPLLWETLFLGGDRGEGLKGLLRYLNVQHPSPLLTEYIKQAEKCEISVSELRMRWIEMDQFRLDLLNFMNAYDIIVCPVSATPAKLHGRGLKEIKDFTYTMSFNLAGWPSVVIRCGTSPEGLPIGIQIIAKPWQDHVALALARKLEALLGPWETPQLNL
jgi:amidase